MGNCKSLPDDADNDEKSNKLNPISRSSGGDEDDRLNELFGGETKPVRWAFNEEWNES